MSGLAWIVALLVLGLGVMVLEVFVPSGGILGMVSLAALVAAVATAFVEHGATGGVIAAGVVVLAVPAVLAAAFRWFPETPLGRRVLPPLPEADELVPGRDRRRHARELVGSTGTTLGELLPWGSVEIDGGRIEAVSEGGPLAAGIRVTVVAAQGGAVVVRPLEAPRTREPPRAEPPLPPAAAEPSRPEQPDTALSPTLETFEFDRLDPPA